MADLFLPIGFTVNVHGDLISLDLEGARLAFAVQVSSAPDAPWRICFRPDQLNMSYRFMSTETGARRLMAAYAWKREDGLRELAMAIAARRRADSAKLPNR